MKRFTVGTAIFVVLLFTSLSAGGVTKITKPTKTVKIPTNGVLSAGAKAPNLGLWDLQNRPVFLKELIKTPGTKAVLVSFYASWCVECPPGLKMLQAAREELAKKGIQILLVDVGEDAKTIERFNKGLGITLPVVSDEFNEAQHAYGAIKLPMSFLVSPEQKVKAIYQYEGADFIETLARDAGAE